MSRGQQTVDGHVAPWSAIGFSGLSGEVVALPAGDDLELLVTYSDGMVVTTRYVNQELKNVRGVDAGRVTGRPTGVVKNDGKVQIFARRADGKIHTLRDTTSGLETSWTTIDGVTAAGAPAVVISKGRIRLAVRGTDGFIYTNSQASPDGAFTGWYRLTDSRSGTAWMSDTEPSMVALSTEKVVVMYRGADDVTYAFESTAGVSSTARSASAGDRYSGGPSPKPKTLITMMGSLAGDSPSVDVRHVRVDAEVRARPQQPCDDRPQRIDRSRIGPRHEIRPHHDEPVALRRQHPPAHRVDQRIPTPVAHQNRIQRQLSPHRVEVRVMAGVSAHRQLVQRIPATTRLSPHRIEVLTEPHPGPQLHTINPDGLRRTCTRYPTGKLSPATEAIARSATCAENSMRSTDSRSSRLLNRHSATTRVSENPLSAKNFSTAEGS